MSSLESLPSRPTRRGLFDATLALLLLYAVYAKTPCGALPVWAYRKAMNQPTPNLLATFRGRETSVDLELPDTSAGLLASQSFAPPVTDAARRSGVDAELLVSYLGATSATCDATRCDVPAPPYLDQIRETYDGREEVPLTELALGLAAAARELDNDLELAVEALYIGPAQVERAVSQARASGLDDPTDVEVHATFLSPSTRRGPLQGAVRVLAYHRLRTLAWPADPKWRISSPYGDRIHPVLGTKRFHNGTDIAAPTGEPLLAAQRGHVARRGRDSVSGNFIQIDHGFDIQSTYCHMSRVDVDADQRVARAARVGAVGATGRVTGPHLHYILRIGGKTVDPELYGEAPRRRRATGGEVVVPEVDLGGAEEEKPKAARGGKKARGGKAGSKKAGAKKARDAKADDAKAVDAKAVDAKAVDAKADDARAGDARADDERAGDARADNARADDARADDKQADDKQADDKQVDDKQPDDKQAGDKQADDTSAKTGVDDDTPQPAKRQEASATADVVPTGPAEASD